MLYLTFIIMYGIRLNDWDDSTRGQCYSASRIAVPDGLYLVGDQIYLGIISLYCFTLLFVAAIESRAPSQRDNAQKTVVGMGLLQFILHVYTAISLRISNQSLLSDPSLEEKGDSVKYLQSSCLAQPSSNVERVSKVCTLPRKFYIINVTPH